MRNELLLPDTDVFDQVEVDSRPDLTRQVTIGTARLFIDLGYSPMLEFLLPNGRRADIAGLNKKGHLIIAEVKSCRSDFLCDEKWETYLDFCDSFFFAVDATFPREILPDCEGLILADKFGGTINRQSREFKIAPARRKSLTLSFARQAASRLIANTQCDGRSP